MRFPHAAQRPEHVFSIDFISDESSEEFSADLGDVGHAEAGGRGCMSILMCGNSMLLDCAGHIGTAKRVAMFYVFEKCKNAEKCWKMLKKLRDILAHIRELPSPPPMFREAAQHANDIHEAFPGIIPSLIPVFDIHCIPQRQPDLKPDASIQNLLTHAMENATAQEIHNNTNKTSLSKRIHAMPDSIARRFQPQQT